MATLTRFFRLPFPFPLCNSISILPFFLYIYMYVDICIFFGFSVCFRWLPSSIFLISVLCRSAPLENYSARSLVCPYIIPTSFGGLAGVCPSRPLSRSLTHSPQIQFVAKHFSSFLCTELNGHENITVTTGVTRWGEHRVQKLQFFMRMLLVWKKNCLLKVRSNMDSSKIHTNKKILVRFTNITDKWVDTIKYLIVPLK